MPIPGVYVEETRPPPRIEGVPTSVTAFIGRAPKGPRDRNVDASPTPVTSWAEYERIFGGLSVESTLGYMVKQFFDNGGRDALIVRAGKTSTPLGDADIAAPKLEARGRGLWALERAKHVNLICIPPLSRGANGDISAATRRAAAAYCHKRRGIFIVDPLSRWQSVADVLGGVRSAEFGLEPDANAALYFPQVMTADPLQGGGVARFAPCGAVAGVIARIDQTLGVWKAAAGSHADLRGIDGPETALSDADMTLLNPMAVNCLRRIEGRGNLIWGARTWSGRQGTASEWKYLNVRRLALYLESSIERGTQWAALEPNGEATWAVLRQSTGSFLHDLFRAGAFQGTRASDAYFVRCDSSNNTAADVQAGLLQIEIGFAPLRPAEFIVLRVSHRVGS